MSDTQPSLFFDYTIQSLKAAYCTRAIGWQKFFSTVRFPDSTSKCALPDSNLAVVYSFGPTVARPKPLSL